VTDVLPDNVKEAIRAATPLGRFATVDEIAAPSPSWLLTRRATSRAKSSASTAGWR